MNLGGTSLLLPSAGEARPFWTLENLKRASPRRSAGRFRLQFMARRCRASVGPHTPERFEEYMKYLHEKGSRRSRERPWRKTWTGVRSPTIPEDHRTTKRQVTMATQTLSPTRPISSPGRPGTSGVISVEGWIDCRDAFVIWRRGVSLPDRSGPRRQVSFHR